MEEIGRRGTLLENLIVEITAPNTPPKAGELWPALLRTPLLSPLHLLQAYLEQKMGLFPPFNQIQRGCGDLSVMGLSPVVESLALIALMHQPNLA